MFRQCVRWNQTGVMQPVRATFWGFVPRLAAFYAALFILPGIQMPFFPVWLKAKGLDPKMIGIVLAVPMVARVLAIPVVTRAADRRDAIRGAMVLACVASVAGYTLVGLSAGAVAILIAYTLTSLASTPVMPLSETYALKGLSARGRTYGPVRLWGSFAYIVGNFAAGFAADIMPARDLIWLMVAATILLALAASMLPALPPPPHEPDGSSRPRPVLLRDPAFIAVLAAAGLIQASHAFFYGFSAVQWRAAGFDGTVIAALWGLGVAAEIVLFAMQARLPPFFEPTVLLLVGACGAVLALGGDGARSARAHAAISAGAARVVIWRDPSRRADVSDAPRAATVRRQPRKVISRLRSDWRWPPRRRCPACCTTISAAAPIWRWR